jgi:hypothetical protein
MADSELLGAAAVGDLRIVKKLLSDDPALITEKDDQGRSALLLAALNGHTPILQWLLAEGGAQISDADELGETALLIAVRTKRFDLAGWLLTKGGSSLSETNLEEANVWDYLGRQIELSYTAEARAGYLSTSQVIPIAVILRRVVNTRVKMLKLLKLIVTFADPSPEFASSLQPHVLRSITEGRKLREKHHAVIVKHCPLPAVLTNIVNGYAEPIDGGDVSAWTGLGVAVKTVKGGWFSRMLSNLFSCSGSGSASIGQAGLIYRN